MPETHGLRLSLGHIDDRRMRPICFTATHTDARLSGTDCISCSGSWDNQDYTSDGCAFENSAGTHLRCLVFSSDIDGVP